MKPSADITSWASILALIWAQLAGVSRTAWDKEYDYIIVGGGSAGAVLASRLSEDARTKVLLLEAGGPETFFADLPISAALLQKSPVDWSYKTVPQRHTCFANKHQRSTWPQGKGLGGSSSINYMLYERGNRRDYDHWAAQGAEGWSWPEVLPYFLRAEDQRNATLAISEFHSANGPLTVSTPEVNKLSPLAFAFIEAGQQLGYPQGDYNGARQSVFSLPQATIRDGRRCSTSKAYLTPSAKAHKNLHVVTLAYVTQILLDKPKTSSVKPKPVARGVKFRHALGLHEVYARNEIIVSAGAIGSPRLLMLSGIGPRDHLERLGISSLSDLPVGENLQDHVHSTIVFTVQSKSSPTKAPGLQLDSILKLPTYSNSPSGFVKTKFVNQRDDWPDVQILMRPGSPISTSGDLVKKIQDLKSKFFHGVYGPYKSTDTMSLMPTVLRPKSRGTIRLSSSNPHDELLIDPKYLSHPADIAVMVEAMKIAIELGATPALQRYNATLLTTWYPGCEAYKIYSEAYLACMARVYLSTMHHPVGTCRMGCPCDPRTVVDSQLRVKGVANLRVVDASVMPTIVSGGINAAVIMIAEKAADMIRAHAEERKIKRARS